MRYIFFHGRGGSPTGAKVTLLRKIAEAQPEAEVLVADHTRTDAPRERVSLAFREFAHLLAQPSQPGATAVDVVLIGSSMGGYVACNLASKHRVRGLFLMAPALYMPGCPVQEYPLRANAITIVHGVDDDVVPVASSRRLVASLPPGGRCDLVEVKDGHRLEGSFPTLEERFAALCRTAWAGKLADDECLHG